MVFGKQKFTKEQLSEWGRKGAIKRNRLYGSPFLDPKIQEKIKESNTSEKGRKGAIASNKKHGSPFKNLWKNQREFMMSIAQKGHRLSFSKESIEKRNRAAFKKNYIGPLGEPMYSPGEVNFASELKSRNIDYEYEPYIGSKIVPDFKVNGKIIEIAGVHLTNYWERLTNKVKLYKEMGIPSLIYNTTRITFNPPFVFDNITRDIHEVIKFIS